MFLYYNEAELEWFKKIVAEYRYTEKLIIAKLYK